MSNQSDLIDQLIDVGFLASYATWLVENRGMSRPEAARAAGSIRQFRHEMDAGPVVLAFRTYPDEDHEG